MKIEILLIVGGAVIITIVAFLLYDKRNKNKAEQVEEVEEEHVEASVAPRNSSIIDYNVYEMKKQEFILYASLAGLVFFAIGFIFYNNLIAALVFSALGLLYPRFQKQILIKKRKTELSRQFQQALFSLSSSLVAGRSIENAFLEVTKDLELLYPDPDTYIIKEFERINRRVANREPIEHAIADFSERAG
ncbi:type II secretion system F family protein, partial [Desertibacillus haloalkaliphilus]|uniref:type II secretion system F family protein n=1 Tax=Desertibacillus haloalkaliphilus TaxID=1328930 RepID=UPI0034D97D35|nr:pilus assembly protein TadB [Desertibacillus haloalkaliphilus]